MRDRSTLLNLAYARASGRAALVRTLSVLYDVSMGRLDRPSSLDAPRNLVWPRRRAVDEVRAVLADVGLAPEIFRHAGTVSGGRQQRVSVSRTLCDGRPIAVGDEPVSALDPVQGAAVLKRLAARHETLVLALHDVDLALARAARVLALDRGTVALDPPAGGLRPAAARWSPACAEPSGVSGKVRGAAMPDLAF